MSLPVPPFPDDYEAIADAVMETERGRWFLAEYARRNRAADTGAVLDALNELERRLSHDRAVERETMELSELMRGVSTRAALIREELEDAKGDRHVDRALRHLDRLDRLVALAVGETPVPWPGRMAAPEPAEPESEPEPSCDPASFESGDFGVFEELNDIIVAEDAPVLALEAEPPVQDAAPCPRPHQPAAWTPGLLESLSEAEKAILFA
ncbi:hypothetical protein [Hansschlegelia plantiphila]|uniref:Uncharacterized protein n=1 Tax=Hansschlegelia plantiphila TaxID=374655 RepID=A0A9W6MV37_9HYPH|nr:hypothetical protein [Hansschlegelia plantiphila]GLK68049.1 hypothetical protein GCM10008179_16870 [Hansschlegelia plantiphila]